jgi:hypothetical protein
MAFPQRLYSKEELAQCGNEIYESQVRQRVIIGRLW